MRRRSLLAGAAGWPWLAACDGRPPPVGGGWVGVDMARGHRLRDGCWPRADTGSDRRVAVAIVGGGIAGLAAAHALRAAGIDDLRLFELEDSAGGNARGHAMQGIRCPLGAHYLPVPGPDATEVRAWLHDEGLLRADPLRPGRWLPDERQLCHAPQERLFVPDGRQPSGGRWHDGPLPLDDAAPATLAAVRRFAAALTAQQAALRFTQPTLKSGWSAGLAALDAQTFAGWLAANGHVDPTLLAYLDYCCRDDYGAGLGMVSAWAGIHYFASRHGFRAPGAEPADDVDAVFTWPEGNAHLAERLAMGLGDRLRPASVVTRIAPSTHAVALDVWDARADAPQRWQAQQVIVCVPLFIAARLIDPLPPALAAVAPRIAYAPWLVSNLLLREPLLPRLGPAPAWDNVIAGSPALGYVDATHQSLRPVPGPTVLTHYWALGGQSPSELTAQRARLVHAPWAAWRDAVLGDLVQAHPDLPGKVVQLDAMRYGHAMCIPSPGLRGDPALAALAVPQGRLAFAHADLSACSTFEEAFTRGQRAGSAVAALRTGP